MCGLSLRHETVLVKQFDEVYEVNRVSSFIAVPTTYRGLVLLQQV